jgi:L-galactose dehydrogenase
VALRFCLDHPYVSSTLVGMSTPAEVNANLKALDFQPDPALLAAIEQIVSPLNNAA